MNILSELTRHLIIASKTLPEKKLVPVTPKIELKDVPKISPMTLPLQELQIPRELRVQPELKAGFIPSLSIPRKQKLEFLTNPEDDFGKLSPLVSDPSISSVVCDGPLKPIKVKKGGRSELTSITLDKSEIDSLINLFSRKSMAPIRPVFRASFGNLSILALISSSESRFLLTKN